MRSKVPAKMKMKKEDPGQGRNLKLTAEDGTRMQPIALRNDGASMQSFPVLGNARVGNIISRPISTYNHMSVGYYWKALGANSREQAKGKHIRRETSARTLVWFRKAHSTLETGRY